jgi:exonuclease SbcC
MLDLPITVEQYEAARVAYASAESASRVAFDAERIAKDAADRAADALAQAKRRIDETAEARAKLASIEAERLVVEELDRTMGDLRESLNFALRPELAEIASGLLDTLTDGRYSHAEFSEDYELTVLEDGLVKPVISGGEEDLCNLVLRLAISQMIAARAGHAFSLLILDEVFGALDDNRRANVMALLRRLGDRFTQIIVITHIGHVRDALDHVVRLEYDALSGSSRVVGDASDMAPVEDLPLLTQAAA